MVRLVEFTDELVLDYDLMDDLYHYMMNDDDFYRKNYYPAMNKAKQTGNNEMMMPVIEYAMSEYAKKFNVPTKMMDMVTPEDKKTLMARMFDAENEE